jgi:hypothetical protein
MSKSDDIYTRVAEKTGASRSFVKRCGLQLFYSINVPSDPAQLEQELVNLVMVCKSFTSPWPCNDHG